MRTWNPGMGTTHVQDNLRGARMGDRDRRRDMDNGIDTLRYIQLPLDKGFA